MDVFYVDNLPPKTGKGTLLRLIIEVGGLSKHRVGKIELSGSLATVEVSEGWGSRLVQTLDGRSVEARRIRVWQRPAGEGDAHFVRLRRWLALESEAERSQQATSDDDGQGPDESCLERLVLRSEDVGLGGTVLVQLAPRNQEARLAWTRLTTGAPVILAEEGVVAGAGSNRSWRGLVTRLSSRRIELALNQAPEPSPAAATFRIEPASDEISRQRMERALTRVESARGARTAVLRQVLIGDTAASFREVEALPETPVLAALNASQRSAIAHALSAEDVAIIHGPPGTGKTTTLAALMATAVARGERILACAPSNMGVDNMAERLATLGVRIVRLGHPVRVLASLQSDTLTALVEQHADYRQAHKLRKEAFQLGRQAARFRRAQPEKGARQALRQEVDALFAEARQLEAGAVDRVLDGAEVVLTTLTGLDSAIVGRRQFDRCVIDEAGQAVEPATWIPLTRSDKVVLAGDHQQLPPTILSQTAVDEGFGISLMERLMREDGTRLARRLTVQYRMHEQIMAFSSAEFYESSLQADPSVRHHLLSGLPAVAGGPLTDEAVTFIDTAGASYDEERVPDSTTYRNHQEAALALRKVEQLRAAGVPAQAIAVITPYRGQVQWLREALPEAVEVGSVDAFQGREKEAIIISLVRSNSVGQIGFLKERRRMNVALTRARRKLIVIGDSATITQLAFYGRLLDSFERSGAYHSVWEEIDY